MTNTKKRQTHISGIRNGTPNEIDRRMATRRSKKAMTIALKSEFVTAQHWATIRKYERRLGTPENLEFRELATDLRVATEGWNYDWKLTPAQRLKKGNLILELVDSLHRELFALEGDGLHGAGQWLTVMEYHDIRLFEQLEGVKRTVTRWQALPSPTTRPAGANAARNFFIWYLADCFLRRYGRRLLEVVHAFSCAYFESSIELELSAVSKIARRLD